MFHMNFLGIGWEGQKRSTYLSPIFGYHSTSERALLRKAQEIVRSVFGWNQELSINFHSKSNYGGTSCNISLHPLFAIPPDQFPQKFPEKNPKEKSVMAWTQNQFNNSVDLERSSFPKAWKIYRFLAEHPNHFEGVRNFIIAKEVASIESGPNFQRASFYSDIGNMSTMSRWTYRIAHTIDAISFAAVGLGIFFSSLFITAFGVVSVALVLFQSRRNAKKDRRILLNAVEATGDVKSAIIYYKLIRFYNPRRLDWVRRNTIDRIMGFHDPLKTLYSLPAKKDHKKPDPFATPFFTSS